MLGHHHVLSRPGPVSNTERQRQFRERNPGYYGRLHRKRNAAIAAALAAEADAEQAALPQKQPLMLPEGVEPLILPGLNAPLATPERELVALRQAAA